MKIISNVLDMWHAGVYLNYIKGCHMLKTGSGIYMIKNKVSGNEYIGSTTNLSVRISRHKYVIKNGLRDNLFILEDAIKFGPDSFEYSTVEHCEVSKLQEREDYYFRLLQPSYNVWNTIYSAKDRVYTPEQKERLVASALINLEKINSYKDIQRSKLKKAWIKRKDNPNFKEIMAKSSRLGKQHSQETKETMSKNRLGKKKPSDFGEKIRQSRLGTKWDSVNKIWIKTENINGI